MDQPWVNIIKASGAVGVVALLIYTLLSYIFSDQIIQLFGSDRIFTLSFIIIVTLLIILLAAILISKKELKVSHKPSNPKVTYTGKSTHNGDNNF